MGDQSSAPPPPDTSKYSDAAYEQGQLMSGWMQEMWDTGQQEWSKLQSWGEDFMGQAMPAMEDMFSWAADAKQQYENMVVPAMQSLFSDAETYASKGEESRQRAAAVQDMKAATEAQREAHRRKLESFGTDPTETRHLALDKQAGVAEAAMSALAANTAGERTKQIGRDLRTQAIGVGQNMAGQMMQATGQGSAVGAQGLGAATGATVGGMNVAQGAIPYAQGAYGGYDLGAGIVDTSYGRTLDQTEVNNAAAQQGWDNALAVGKSVGGMSSMVATGGAIMAPGGPTDDAGAVSISDGEYVIPADVVMKMGTNHFDKMIEKETGRPPPSPKTAIPIDPSRSPSPSAGGVPMSPSTAGVIQ